MSRVTFWPSGTSSTLCRVVRQGLAVLRVLHWQ